MTAALNAVEPAALQWIVTGDRSEAESPTPRKNRHRESRAVSDEASREITRVLQDLADPARAREELLPHLYQQLKELAQRRMADERVGHTLQATALVHEAYLRLVDDAQVAWEGRSCFFVAASEAMRRILVDHARKHRSLKRGGDRQAVPLEEVEVSIEQDPDQTLAVDEALRTLDDEDPRAAQVVRLRFFAGLSVEECASVLGISERTVMREWSFARARLYQVLDGGTPDEPNP